VTPQESRSPSKLPTPNTFCWRGTSRLDPGRSGWTRSVESDEVIKLPPGRYRYRYVVMARQNDRRMPRRADPMRTRSILVMKAPRLRGPPPARWPASRHPRTTRDEARARLLGLATWIRTMGRCEGRTRPPAGRDWGTSPTCSLSHEDGRRLAKDGRACLSPDPSRLRPGPADMPSAGPVQSPKIGCRHLAGWSGRS